MDFLAAEFDEGFFVGAIAKDFCVLSVQLVYNYMMIQPNLKAKNKKFVQKCIFFSKSFLSVGCCVQKCDQNNLTL